MKLNNSRSDPAKAKVAQHRGRLSLFVIFVILVVGLIFIDPSNLPDYEAYERIYQNSLLMEDWEIFFIFVNFLFNQSGFSYSNFRDFILIFSMIALLMIYERVHPNYFEKSVLLRVVNFFMMFFFLGLFLFEYSLIRIRAGFSIGIIWCALFFMLSSKELLGRTLALLFIVLAFFTHRSTTLVLVVFVGLPFIASIWKGRARIKSRLFVTASIVSVAFLLYVTNSTYELRGEHIYSPLNPVRFVMLSIIPLLMFFLVRNESKSAGLNGDILSEFPNYFIRFYAVLAFALSCLFFAGLTGESGEALVRLYTLSSVPALLSLRLSGSVSRAPISAYILMINALFFLVTIFLPGGQGG